MKIKWIEKLTDKEIETLEHKLKIMKQRKNIEKEYPEAYDDIKQQWLTFGVILCFLFIIFFKIFSSIMDVFL